LQRKVRDCMDEQDIEYHSFTESRQIKDSGLQGPANEVVDQTVAKMESKKGEQCGLNGGIDPVHPRCAIDLDAHTSTLHVGNQRQIESVPSHLSVRITGTKLVEYR
jgi:hypothetical protein